MRGFAPLISRFSRGIVFPNVSSHYCALFPSVCFAEHRNSSRPHADLSSMLYACVGIGSAPGLHGEYPGNGAFFVEAAASSKKGSPPITILTTKPADTSELLIRHFLSASRAAARGEILGGYKISNFISPPPRPFGSQTRANIDYRVLSYAPATTPRINRAR